MDIVFLFEVLRTLRSLVNCQLSYKPSPYTVIFWDFTSALFLVQINV